MTDKPDPAAESAQDAPDAVEDEAKPATPKRGGIAVGAAAVGIGSAAVVAALLYVRHRKRGA